MFNEIGVLYVDHVAVTTNHFEETISYYLSLPEARLINGPGHNLAQQVKFAFISVAGMGAIEVLAPLNEQSPLWGHLRQGGGAYHFCYAVENLQKSIEIAISKGAKLIVSEKPDDAFYGRSVAFLIHPYLGLFELLEAYPAYLQHSLEAYKPIVQPTTDTKHTDNHGSVKGAQVVDVFNRVMNAKIADTDNVTMQNYTDWDSVKHILLMMELENTFGIQISSEYFSQLITLDDIVQFINKKTE